MARLRRLAPDALAAVFAASGIVHLVRPATFDALLPPFLPAPAAIITISGLAELVCAAGLVRRAGWAGPASAWLLVAVFPGNVWFALGPESSDRPSWIQAAALLRLPIQLALIWAALQVTRVDKRPDHVETPNDR